MFTFLTDRKTGAEILYNLGRCERIEARSHGCAIYYEHRTRPVRVNESIREVAKRLNVRKTAYGRGRRRRY